MAQLGSQELGGGTFQQHLLKRKQKKSIRRRVMVAGLTLTSMVDMFSLLVIFLLQTFSTSPELVMVTKGVSLPRPLARASLKTRLFWRFPAKTCTWTKNFSGKRKIF